MPLEPVKAQPQSLLLPYFEADSLALFSDKSPATQAKAELFGRLFPGFVDIPTGPMKSTVVTIEGLAELERQKGQGTASSPPVPPSSAPTPAATSLPPATKASSETGDPQLDGLVKEIVKTNNDIDSLLEDYQKAVNGELKDAKGNKIDPFVIQTKLQQAMQRRLELITLLSNIQKMSHDATMAIVNNIR